MDQRARPVRPLRVVGLISAMHAAYWLNCRNLGPYSLGWVLLLIILLYYYDVEKCGFFFIIGSIAHFLIISLTVGVYRTP